MGQRESRKLKGEIKSAELIFFLRPLFCFVCFALFNFLPPPTICPWVSEASAPEEWLGEWEEPGARVMANHPGSRLHSFYLRKPGICG